MAMIAMTTSNSISVNARHLAVRMGALQTKVGEEKEPRDRNPVILASPIASEKAKLRKNIDVLRNPPSPSNPEISVIQSFRDFRRCLLREKPTSRQKARARRDTSLSEEDF
jgi:hypothetical protein